MTQSSLEEVSCELGGVRDECAIVCEPFIQWVIEDNFIAGRPDWELAGAQLVSDVLPFEKMKIRMLNGSHSFLAYLGILNGYQYISDCMQDSYYVKAARHVMINEQAPTLDVDNVNLLDYADQLIDRYSNTSLQHRTQQIAMDGTQKLPQRFLESIHWHLENNSDYTGLAIGVAGWMRCINGIDDLGNEIKIFDPMMEKLKDIVNNSSDDKHLVISLLNLHNVFGEKLSASVAFVKKITYFYLSLLHHGAYQTIKSWIDNI
jgi:fructuronate reductase